MTLQVKNSTESNSLSVVQKCSNCGKTDEKLKVCSKCHFERYCDVPCQRKHWPTHKKVCQKSESPPSEVWEAVARKAETWKGGDIKASLGPLLTESHPSHVTNLKQLWDFINLGSDQLIPDLMKQFFSSLIRPEGKKLALDLGSGTGNLSLYLVERGWKVIAIDFSAKSLAKLREKADTQDKKWLETGQLVTIEKEIATYVFPSEQFDLIVASDIFPYYNPMQLRSLFTQIHGSLKEGGSLLGSFFKAPEFPPIKSVQEEMGAWFIDSSAMAKSLIVSSGFDCKIIREPEGYPGIEFLAVKK